MERAVLELPQFRGKVLTNRGQIACLACRVCGEEGPLLPQPQLISWLQEGEEHQFGQDQLPAGDVWELGNKIEAPQASEENDECLDADKNICIQDGMKKQEGNKRNKKRGKTIACLDETPAHQKRSKEEKMYEKTSAQRSAYDNHGSGHTREKLSNCLVCRKTFSSSRQLSNHNRIHTEEKP
ncbi:hypothetical protein JD844_013915, partial [Phrynosoma platyrhinos]